MLCKVEEGLGRKMSFFFIQVISQQSCVLGVTQVELHASFYLKDACSCYKIKNFNCQAVRNLHLHILSLDSQQGYFLCHFHLELWESWLTIAE